MVISLILIFIVILFLPIPLKIKIRYADKKFTIKIYNLNIKHKFNLNKDQRSSNNSTKNNGLFFFINKLRSQDFKEIKMKSPIKVNIKFAYGLNDAAYTALIYGVMSSLKAFLFNKLNKIFLVKQYNFHIKPDFNNFYFKLEVNSIIYMSLVKIIYVYIKLSSYKNQSKKLNKSISGNSA
ncbi:DUF2953 domain-containing protein [Clostridium sp. Mt-5]|uniref:DUF2953 domain-containing protein n=1 Tax=Clostridium moutaii TaxID=3240932 RepID=A0ABV4BL03_9CLOT